MAIGRTNAGGAANRLPQFTYTGSYVFIDDGDKNWRIKLLESGTLVFAASITIDLFLVGGGGGSHKRSSEQVGACGGYTKTVPSISLAANTSYPIVVGAGGIASDTTAGPAGGASSAFGQSVLGGDGAGHNTTRKGGSGGAGVSGLPGTDGANGTGTWVGLGQGTTTREFGEPTGTLYSTGGYLRPYIYTKRENTGEAGDSYTTNNTKGGDGASGIVIIRNRRT